MDFIIAFCGKQFFRKISNRFQLAAFVYVAGLVSTVPALKLYALPALKLYAL
jgi:hypothetical protein